MNAAIVHAAIFHSIIIFLFSIGLYIYVIFFKRSKRERKHILWKNNTINITIIVIISYFQESVAEQGTIK